MSKEIDWKKVQKVLVVRLRSIGDTVLSTPSLIALRKFLPDAQIDILLEDWVAPVLEGFESIDNVLVVSKDTKDRIKLARKLRKEKYDVAFNLHGGTTSTFLIRASGAKYRVASKNHQYKFLYTHLLDSSLEFWDKETIHSVEEQLAILGFVGVPVQNSQKAQLTINKNALNSVKSKIQNSKSKKIALLHPLAAFETKQWATENFAMVSEHLEKKCFQTIAVATPKERDVLENLKSLTNDKALIFDNLSLPEIIALASEADLFVGNDSGVAHIAAAVQTPSIVIFGSSNRDNWRPWTDAPNEVVFEKMSCQPCPGYVCEKFDKPRCVLDLKVEKAIKAINKILN